MKAKNWQEIKGLTINELEARFRSLQEQLFRLKFRHSSTPLKNALEIRSTRRMVARIKTLLKEKTAALTKTAE